MKLSCDRVSLLSALRCASQVAKAKSPSPASRSVMMESRGGTITIFGNGDNISVAVAAANCSADSGGVLVLPPDPMIGLMSESSDKTVEIESDGPLANIALSDGRARIVGMNLSAEELNVYRIPNAQGTVTVAMDDLREVVSRTAFAVSEQEKGVFCGVFLRVGRGEIKAMACDGRRFSLASKPFKSDGDSVLDIIVPPKAFEVLFHVAEESGGSASGGSVTIGFAGGRVVFAMPFAMVASHVYSGEHDNFPLSRLEQKSDFFAKIKVAPLRSAIKRALLVTDDKTKAMRIDAKPGEFVVFTRSQTLGEVSIRVDADYKGPEAKITINPQLTAEGLSALRDDVACIEFGDENKAFIVRGTDGFTYLVMPLTAEV